MGVLSSMWVVFGEVANQRPFGTGFVLSEIGYYAYRYYNEDKNTPAIEPPLSIAAGVFGGTALWAIVSVASLFSELGRVPAIAIGLGCGILYAQREQIAALK